MSCRGKRFITTLRPSKLSHSPTLSLFPSKGLYISSEDLITEDEEKRLVAYSDQLLGKRRYVKDHWDSVITKYRETELIDQDLPDDINSLLQNLGEKIIAIHGKKMKLKSPHVIDLHQDGFIDSHVDSIKFSGEIVAGLSLLTPRIFRLTIDDDFKHLYTNQNVPQTIEFIAHPRRLYILSDTLRYHYGHAVLKTTQTDLVDMSEYKIGRRMSIIFRDELEGQEGIPYRQ